MQHYSTIIVPSHTEAFGLVMAEAMTNKCLVIARNIDGLKEQFDNGLNEHGDEIGLRFDTSHQLFMRMKESIVMTTEQRQAMIKRAYETVSKLYAEERCACETFLFFNNCITRDKHGVK
jgi:glycosyltransferase involved in cell wall biosynthesis